VPRHKRAAIYLRVSTSGQSTMNQRLELERVAEQRGWQIVSVCEDHAISGSKGRDQRPAFDQLHKDAARGKIDVVMAWSIDRLGRSLHHVISFIAELGELGVGLYLHQQAVDSSTPAGKAMLAMCGVFAEFEREMLRERVHAGLQRARAEGKRLGRPPVSSSTIRAIKTKRAAGTGILKIARELGIGTSVVQRVVAQS
jgi:DNA invertase Pin-like site-specific DNA recombinase